MSDDPEVAKLLAEARALKGLPPAAESDAGGSQPQPPATSSAPSGEPQPDPAALARAAQAVAAATATATAGPAAGPAAQQQAMALPGLWKQTSILVGRNVDLYLADMGGTALLLIQAPLIGYLMSLAFDGRGEDKTIDFILSVVAVWLGCIGACRELVKERAILLRERRAGVSVAATVLAKLTVLAFLAALQALILVVMCSRTISFEGSLVGVFFVLALTIMSASGLGLLISAITRTQAAAVALVPIVLVPQLIFSEVTIKDAPLIVERIEAAMLASWAYEALRIMTKSKPDWFEFMSDGLVIAAMGVGCALLASAAASMQSEG